MFAERGMGHGTARAEVFFSRCQRREYYEAAKMLHITQPTLSRQLMQMEEEFGVSLFKRSKHSIILTEEGMILRRRTQELVDLAEKTAKEVSRQDEVISGEIAIGCGETKNLEPMAKVMAAFQQAYGEVQFTLYTALPTT